jgi:molybdopterin-binding protein
MPVRFSARNQIRAKVISITFDEVMAEIILELADGQQIVSAITATSARNLNIKEGDNVLAIVKSTEVMLGKDM